jgi:unsaturated chondroitin disaccharide hydrolase
MDHPRVDTMTQQRLPPARVSRLFVAAVALVSACATDSPPDTVRAAHPGLDADIEDAFTFARERIEATAAEIHASHPQDFASFYPTSTETRGDAIGRWQLEGAEDWRSGFFPGELWQMFRRTGDAAFLEQARAWSEPIADYAEDAIDYDIGNRFNTTFGLGYRLSNDRNDPGGAYRARAREMILTAAATLDRRFNMRGIQVGALRALDTYMAPYPVYIDGMMNLELLFLGWDVSGRPASGPPATWYRHAVTSAVTTMEQNVRADGSTYHIVQHDDGTHGTRPDGGIYAKISDQGYAPESTWSRGQAWALYGFTMVYRFTKDDPAAEPSRFLDTTRRAADYFIARLPSNYVADGYDHAPGDFVPPSDFDAALGEPVGPYNDANGDHVFGDRKPPLRAFVARDSSAAAAAASGLFELGTLVQDPAEKRRYLGAAEDILRSLLTFRGPDGELAYLAKRSPHRGVLANGSVSWGRPTSSLIYGDYFLLEAMNRYRAIRDGRPL